MKTNNLATIGYSKHNTRWLVKELDRGRVGLVIDVRSFNSNRDGHRVKDGFSADQLAPILERAQISYQVCQQAGNPIRGGTFFSIMDRYASRMKGQGVVELVAGLCKDAWSEGKTPCLLCACDQHDWCHRGILAGLVLEATKATHPAQLLLLPIPKEPQPELF